MVRLKKLMQEIRETYSANANPVIAERMSAYMRDQFSFFGIMKGPRVPLQKEMLSKSAALGKEETEALVMELFACDERELHYLALEICIKKKIWLDKDAIQLIEWLITNRSWWDTVDTIADHLAGKYFSYHPEMIGNVAARWNKSENFWLIRSSIIFQLKYREKTNTEVLSAFILPHTSSKEFFIQKAIGWALRQYARTDMAWVKQFVETHPLAPLSKREALKHA